MKLLREPRFDDIIHTSSDVVVLNRTVATMIREAEVAARAKAFDEASDWFRRAGCVGQAAMFDAMRASFGGARAKEAHRG